MLRARVLSHGGRRAVPVQPTDAAAVADSEHAVLFVQTEADRISRTLLMALPLAAGTAKPLW